MKFSNGRNILFYFRLFSLDMTTRIKVTSIENFWFTSIIQQMFFQTTNSERDKQRRYKLMVFEKDVKTDELISLQKTMKNDANNMKIDNFFSSSTAATKPNEILDEIFLNDIRFLSINEYNDTIVLSSQFLINEKNFTIIFKKLSDEHAFQKYCR